MCADASSTLSLKRQWVSSVVDTSSEFQSYHSENLLGGDVNKYWASKQVASVEYLVLRFLRAFVVKKIQLHHGGVGGPELSRILAFHEFRKCYVTVYESTDSPHNCNQLEHTFVCTPDNVVSKQLRLEFQRGGLSSHVCVGVVEMCGLEAPEFPGLLLGCEVDEETGEVRDSEGSVLRADFVRDCLRSDRDESRGQGEPEGTGTFGDLLLSIGLKHDDTILASFVTFRSFLGDAFNSTVLPSGGESGKTPRRVVRVKLPEEFGTAYRLDPDEFHSFVLGQTNVDEFVTPDRYNDLISLWSVLSRLKMKKHLWLICEGVAMRECSLQEAFQFFSVVFEKFEQPIEDDESVSFLSALSLAAFNRLRQYQDEISKRGPDVDASVKRIRGWLQRNLLFFELLADERTIKDHPEISGAQEKLLSCREILGRTLARLHHGIEQECNVVLVSEADGSRVSTFLEALLLSYDFFRIMLKFPGREQTLFLTSREILIEDLSGSSLELLSQYACTGDLDEDLPLRRLFPLLTHAEKFREHALKAKLFSLITSKDTESVTFVDEMQDCGLEISTCPLKHKCLQAWSLQGFHSTDQLRRILSKASEKTRLDGLEEENRRLRVQLRELSDVVQKLEERLSEVESKVE